MTAAANPTSNPRSATITVRAQLTTGTFPLDMSRTITVTQAAGAVAPTLELSHTSWPAPASGGNWAVTITTNQPIENVTISSNQPWLTISREGAGGVNRFLMTATPNTGAARSGTVTVSVAGLTRTVSVTQQAGAATLEVSPTTWAAPVGGGTQNIAITTNQLWQNINFSDYPSWLTVSGTGMTRTLTAAANTGAARTATVTVRVAGTDVTRTIQVTQAAAQPVDFALRFNANGGHGTMPEMRHTGGYTTLPTSAFTGPTPGHIQIGWRISSPVAGPVYEMGEIVYLLPVDQTLHAVWLHLLHH